MAEVVSSTAVPEVQVDDKWGFANNPYVPGLVTVNRHGVYIKYPRDTVDHETYLSRSLGLDAAIELADAIRDSVRLYRHECYLYKISKEEATE